MQKLIINDVNAFMRALAPLQFQFEKHGGVNCMLQQGTAFLRLSVTTPGIQAIEFLNRIVFVDEQVMIDPKGVGLEAFINLEEVETDAKSLTFITELVQGELVEPISAWHPIPLNVETIQNHWFMLAPDTIERTVNLSETLKVEVSDNIGVLSYNAEFIVDTGDMGALAGEEIFTLFEKGMIGEVR